ncbi:ribonucleotide reductase large subunit Rnr1 [Coccidioides posadasii str. Silveira]|uniref:Ribonucleotide reductase large subunit Rnr1 n=2 Tax=Coccidioides posadasii TaxID=199306 RepID=E9D0Z3_COCPS|nr:ribonucleotide reductase large subunit Rnr1 [Coccidioides posadasii str. Silveira]
MHFAGWKLGLKTGMYYLRTMAASAPIQFTVDQEQLKVADTNVARSSVVGKKRGGGLGNSSGAYSAVPRPMYDQKQPESEPPRPVSPKGIPAFQRTPATAPPDEELGKKQTQSMTKVQVNETDTGEQGQSEQDIYSQKVLQCSIENKEACMMCSG